MTRTRADRFYNRNLLRGDNVRKNRIFLSVLIIVFGMSSTAAANLIINPGFEAGPGLTNWNPSGDALATASPDFVKSGTYSGAINKQGALKQNITLTDASSHIFGGYMRIWTEDPVANWD